MYTLKCLGKKTGWKVYVLSIYSKKFEKEQQIKHKGNIRKEIINIRRR